MSVYPPAGFQFTVQIAGSPEQDDATFQEVSGISPEIDAEIHREGGENRFVHALPKAATHPKLVLKRGIADQRSPLVRWCEAVLEAGLSGPIETKDLTLRLLDETGAPLRDWSFRAAYPVRWTVDSFQGDKARLAIETIELAYSA